MYDNPSYVNIYTYIYIYNYIYIYLYIYIYKHVNSISLQNTFTYLVVRHLSMDFVSPVQKNGGVCKEGLREYWRDGERRSIMGGHALNTIINEI